MLTLFENQRLSFKPVLNDTVENLSGKKFRCYGFGVTFHSGIKEDYYLYRQFNTEGIPVEFTVTDIEYCMAMENKRLFKI